MDSTQLAEILLRYGSILAMIFPAFAWCYGAYLQFSENRLSRRFRFTAVWIEFAIAVLLIVVGLSLGRPGGFLFVGGACSMPMILGCLARWYMGIDELPLETQRDLYVHMYGRSRR